MASEYDFVGTLDKKGIQKAKDELNEDEKNREGAVETLREWIKQQNWLKSPTDSKFLVKFLRTKKYSQLEARKAIERFWRVRGNIPEWFKNRVPTDPIIQDVLKKGWMIRLPRTDDQGRIHVLQRTASIEPEYIKKNLKGADAIFRTAMTLMEWIMMDERAQVNGVVVIIDLTGYGLQHKMLIHTADNIKRFTSAVPTSPVRMKAMNAYNLPPLFEAVLAMVKSFFKQKLRDRIKTHGRTLVSLYESIDMSVLPREYLPDDYTGPCSGTIDEIIDYNMREIVKQPVVDFVTDLTTGDYGVDEKLRPAEDEVPAASFRKLNVD